MIPLILTIYLPLALLALFQLSSSIKRKNLTQIIIFGLVMAICIFRIADVFLFQVRFNNQEKHRKALFFENRNEGDTATFAGWISFHRFDNKAIQDTIDRIDRKNDSATGRSSFHIELPDPTKTEWHLKLIETDLVSRDSLSKFLNYDQQQKDLTTYRLTIKATLKDKIYQTWQLIKVIYVDTLKELPHYWQ
jgi:hypothetical protein